MMMYSIDNIHPSNHFHMTLKIQIVPFLLSYFCFSLTETALNPDVWLWGMGRLQNRGELPMPHPPSLCLAQPHPHMASSWSPGTPWLRKAPCHSAWIPTQWWDRRKEGGGRGERLGESREEGKRKRPYPLFSKFMMERPHFQVNCNTALLSLFLKELRRSHVFFSYHFPTISFFC